MLARLKSCSHYEDPDLDIGRSNFMARTAPSLFTAIGEYQCFSVRVTGRYKHLGGIVHHSGNLKFEAKQRLAVAHQTFTRHRRVLFCNKHIDQQSTWADL